MGKRELNVSALKNGTVIDHIPADRLFDVLNILKLQKVTSMITFGTNLDSNQLGKKGIIKIAEVYFDEHDLSKIALIAPNAKLNIIKDYRVVEKYNVQLPDEIAGFVKCFNPRCVTNHENIPTRFIVMGEERLKLLCYYCEKVTTEEHIEIV